MGGSISQVYHIFAVGGQEALTSNKQEVYLHLVYLLERWPVRMVISSEILPRLDDDERLFALGIGLFLTLSF